MSFPLFIPLVFLTTQNHCPTVAADRDSFHRSVGRLPLEPGTSRLSAAACPDLVQHYRTLVVEADDTPSAVLVRHPPESVELDAMLQLVLNCQQRSQFEADLRRREGLSSETMVAVPEPGVPFNYLGLSPDDDDPTTATTIMDNDDIVDEYDWLRKLVMDRSS